MAKLISLGVMDDGAAYATNGKDVFQLVPGQGNGWRAAPIEADRQVSIMSAYAARGGKLPGAAPQEEAGIAENLGRSFMAGGATAAGAIGQVLGSETVSDLGYDAAESWRKGQSPAWKEAAETPITTEDGGLNPSMTAGKFAVKAADAVAGSGLQMMLGMGVGGAMAKGGMALGMSPGAAGVAGSAISEGSLAGVMNAGQMGKMIDDAPEEKLINSEAYQRAYHSLPGDMDDTVRRQRARQELKSKAMNDVGWATSAATAVFGAPAGYSIGRIIGGETGSTMLRTMAKQGLLEALQEAPQSAYEQRRQNEVVNKFVDPTQDLNEGVLDQFLLGIVTGGAMGTGLGGLAHQDAQEKPPADEENPNAAGTPTMNADGGTSVPGPTLPDFLPGPDGGERTLEAEYPLVDDEGKRYRKYEAGGVVVNGKEALRGGYPDRVYPKDQPAAPAPTVTPEGIGPTPTSEASARATEIRDALDRGQPVPPGNSRVRSDIGVNEALPVEDIEAAPPLPETPPDPSSGLRQAGTDLNGMIEQIDAAPAPIPNNIEVQDEFDDADNNIDVQTVEQIDAAPAPGIAGLLPPPAMSVDSQGTAMPQSQREWMERDEKLSAELRAQELEESADDAEAAGDYEQAIALRREAAGYQQELGDNARAEASRAARMPQGLKDNRILRDFYRNQLQGMADGLVTGGDITYRMDDNGKVIDRTPSVNPQWFKNAGITVAQTQHAVKKALTGRPLGVREARMISGMLDIIHDRRTDKDMMDFARENRAQARRLRRDAALGLPPVSAYEQDIEQAGEMFDEGFYDPDWDGNTRALYEIIHEAHAIDPVRTEQIADSARPDAEVARELLRIIHESKQQGRTQEGAGRQEEGADPAAPAAEASAPAAEAVDPLTQAPLPESEDHLSAQVDAFLAGNKRGVLLSAHVDDRPKERDDRSKTRLNVAVRKRDAVRRDVPQGTLYARPDDRLLAPLAKALSAGDAEAIRSLVGQITLDISPTVAAANPADMDRIVQARDKNGGIVTQVGATAKTEKAATKQLSSQGATVETVPIEQGLKDRQTPIRSFQTGPVTTNVFKGSQYEFVTPQGTWIAKPGTEVRGDGPTATNGWDLFKVTDNKESLVRNFETKAAARDYLKSLGALDETLSGYTEADLADREKQKADAAAARAKADAKTEADQQRGGFTLTGSNSAVDQAEARGQRNMFDAPAPSDDKPAPSKKADVSFAGPEADAVVAARAKFNKVRFGKDKSGKPKQKAIEDASAENDKASERFIESIGGASVSNLRRVLPALADQIDAAARADDVPMLERLLEIRDIIDDSDYDSSEFDSPIGMLEELTGKAEFNKPKFGRDSLFEVELDGARIGVEQGREGSIAIFALDKNAKFSPSGFFSLMPMNGPIVPGMTPQESALEHIKAGIAKRKPESPKTIYKYDPEEGDFEVVETGAAAPAVVETPKTNVAQLKNIPPAVARRVKVNVDQMIEGEGVKSIETTAHDALKDIKRELAAFKKLLDCVRA
jgi:hypothetical protein